MLAKQVTVKSKRGAVKRYNAIIAQCYKDGKGDLQFGIDFPTLAINWPDRYREIQDLKKIYNDLPA